MPIRCRRKFGRVATSFEKQSDLVELRAQECLLKADDIGLESIDRSSNEFGPGSVGPGIIPQVESQNANRHRESVANSRPVGDS